MSGTLPLKDLQIVVTRPLHQTNEFCAMLEDSGAGVIRYPTIEISARRNDAAFQSFIDQIDSVHMLVFNSPNSVAFGVPLIHLSKRIPEHTRIGAIGASTAKELAKYGYHVDDCPPNTFDSESFLELPDTKDIEGKNVVILRAQTGRTLLGETLALRGAKVSYVQVYERSPIKPEQAKLLQDKLTSRIDAVTITSLESFTNFIASLRRDVRQNVSNATFVAGNFRIAQRIKAEGFNSVVIAKDPTNSSMHKALIHWSRHQL